MHIGDFAPRCARSVPVWRTWLAVVAAVALAVAPRQTGAQAVDSLRSAARTAEARYERMARWLAPGTYAGRSGADCDEIVGRFCLTFDTLSRPPAKPPRPEVLEARDRAIGKLREFFSASPGDLQAAGPLVRLLVEAGRADEAIAVAGAYAGVGPDSLWVDWLSGYARHRAGQDRAAEAHFRRALAGVSAAVRDSITSVEWLVDPGEWRRVRSLSPGEAARYHDRFWRAADPMWLTPENEVWVQHVARRVEARLLARVPMVTGMLRWGADLDELTVRYGSPIARERDWNSVAERESFIEHFDTAALAYAPGALLADGLPPVPPGGRWPWRSPEGRSGHSPPSIPRSGLLAHQLTRFPRGDSQRVRLDARTVDGDTVPPAAAVLLGAWPWRGGSELVARGSVPTGEATFTLELLVPRDSLLYSAEAYLPGTRELRFARYVLEPLPASGPLQLSDVLLTEPLPEADSGDLAPAPPALTSLLLVPGQPVGARVELEGQEEGERIDVEVSFGRADPGSFLARAVGWAGRQLGLAARESPPRVRWSEVASERPVIHVNLRAPERRGAWLLAVTVRAGAREATTRRLVVVGTGS